MQKQSVGTTAIDWHSTKRKIERSILGLVEAPYDCNDVKRRQPIEEIIPVKLMLKVS